MNTPKQVENIATYVEPSIFKRFTWWLLGLFTPAPESNLIQHAERELLLVGFPNTNEFVEIYDDNAPDFWMQDNVLELIKVFSEQGHSGLSAPHCIELFCKLAKYELLTPLTGDPDEWIDRSEESGSLMWQNKRCSHVFKEGINQSAYDTQGLVFRDKDGFCYTSRASRVHITFPYTPVTKYVDAKDEQEAANLHS